VQIQAKPPGTQGVEGTKEWSKELLTSYSLTAILGISAVENTSFQRTKADSD
jgi:hypothetical protein